MNAGKLDAELLRALQSDSRGVDERVSVFVRIDPASGADAKAAVKPLGIDIGEGATVFAADLSKQQVSDLSEQPWVKVIRLARTARPLSKP